MRGKFKQSSEFCPTNNYRLNLVGPESQKFLRVQKINPLRNALQHPKWFNPCSFGKTHLWFNYRRFFFLPSRLLFLHGSALSKNFSVADSFVSRALTPADACSVVKIKAECFLCFRLWFRKWIIFITWLLMAAAQAAEWGSAIVWKFSVSQIIFWFYDFSATHCSGKRH